MLEGAEINNGRAKMFHGSITRLEKKYFLALIELKATYNLYGWPRVVLTGLCFEYGQALLQETLQVTYIVG